MDIRQYSASLDLRNGIWYGPEEDISYPDEGSEFYSEIEDESFWFLHRSNCLVELVSQFSPQGPIFDIGGGNGTVSLAFEKNGFPTVLLEPQIGGIKKASDRGLRNLICSSFEKADFQDDSLPAVALLDVVEHIRDDRSFIEGLRQKLIPGGYMYISVPAFEFIWTVKDEYYGHFRRYTTSSIRKLLSSAGLEVMYSSYIFSILPFPIFFLRALPNRIGLNKNIKKLEQTQHKKGREGITGNVLNKIWKWEINQIKKKKPILLGSSCLVVARKSPGKEK
jgi:2-polyprenyl-3-methyl-5-hydroxy-6-metoxy-1,4-benzoquinol methylase